MSRINDLLLKNQLTPDDMTEDEINFVVSGLRVTPTGHYGNIFIRTTVLRRGEITNGHEHNFDHLMSMAHGQFRVEADTPDGRHIDRVFGLGSPFGMWALIVKGVRHKVTGICPINVYNCLYSIRSEDGEVQEERTGWEPAFN